MKQRLYEKFAGLFSDATDAHFYFSPGQVYGGKCLDIE